MNATQNISNPGASMTEKEAYGNSYSQRIATWYRPGDKVKIGPAYRSDRGGEWIADGYEGDYVVVAKLESAGDYDVAKGDVFHDIYNDGVGDLYINAARLTRRE